MAVLQKPNSALSSENDQGMDKSGASSQAAAAAVQIGHAAVAPADVPQAGQAPSGPVIAPQAGQVSAGPVVNTVHGPLFPALARKRRLSRLQVLHPRADAKLRLYWGVV